MRLTLCVIARDESHFLPGCLASVRGVVDEVVVVDTGSADDTVALAAAAGAIVVHHVWDDDFAAARNAALPHATGDYLLVLDADERLAPGAGPGLRRALSTGAVLLGMLPLHDASTLDATSEEVLSGAKRRGERVFLPRVLRRTRDLAWEGRIHESISTWLVRNGGRTTHLEAAIVHYGAVPELRAARGKADRNRLLLERLCAEDPAAPVPYGYLASERARIGDLEGARTAVEQGWAALRVAMKIPGPKPAVVALATIRAQLALAADNPALALATVEEARTMTAEHPNFAFLAGQAAASAGDPLKAIDELASALEQDGGRWNDPVLDGATGWRGRALLAQLLESVGRDDQALGEWQRVVADHPEHPDGWTCLAELHLRAGRPAAAFQVLDGHLTSADAWFVGARAALALEQVDAARTFATKARQSPWLHVARRAGLPRLLAELNARAGQFRAGPGPFGTLGALVSGTVVEAASPVDDDSLAVVVDSLLERGDDAGLDALFSRRAASLVPDLRPRLVAMLEARGLSWEDDGEPDFVFVGGAGRSGTTLFRAMLSAHPDLWCPPERKLVPVLAEFHARQAAILSDDLREAGIDERALDGAAKAWLTSFLRARAPAGKRVAEKTPHNLLHAGWLGRLFPRARFVHVLRDGHAVAESLVRQRWLDPGTGQPVPYCRDLASAAAYWATVVNTIRAQSATLGDRYLEVRYEALVESPKETMSRVLAFLGEAWSDEVLHHETTPLELSARESSTAAVAQALTTTRVDAWRARLSPQEVSAISRAAGPVLEATGYGGVS